MNLEQLKQYLNRLSDSLANGDKQLLKARVKTLISAFPFNKYEYIIMFLLDKKVITFNEYENLREEYVSTNKYLELYTFAPRIFGEIWAHQHLIDLDYRFQRPTRKIDPEYEGQYDLWMDGVRVEVKSARAINTKKRESMVSRALRYDSNEPFWMNYQQIKTNYADVFILIGVWVNKVIYWVMSSEEIRNNRHLSHQHRGGIEYQIGITRDNISDFDMFKVEPSKIGDKVLEKGKRRKR